MKHCAFNVNKNVGVVLAVFMDLLIIHVSASNQQMNSVIGHFHL